MKNVNLHRTTSLIAAEMQQTCLNCLSVSWSKKSILIQFTVFHTANVGGIINIILC